MLLKESLIVRNNAIPTVKMGEELSMLDVNSGKYFVLNEIGVDIWNQLEKPVSVATLLNKLLQEYDVEEEKCTLALQNYLVNMKDRALIEVVG